MKKIISLLLILILFTGCSIQKIEDTSFDSIIKSDSYGIEDSGIYDEDLKPYFSFIKSWKDINHTNINDYLEWYQTKDNNKNKQTLNICKLFNDQTYTEKNYKEYAIRYSKLSEMVNFFKSSSYYFCE